jgi:hypothetical protein
MLRSRIVLLVVIGALSAGGGAAYASTHAPVQKHPVRKSQSFLSNVHYPCHSPGARLSPAQL